MASKSKKSKYEQYRSRIGKPRGPGVKGNKSGKGYTARGIPRARKAVKAKK